MINEVGSSGNLRVGYSMTNEVYMERTSSNEEIYCLANVCAHTQLIEC